MPEGDGGHRCEHDGPTACGCEHPGTGMRRPQGSLYNTPASQRTSILSKAIKSGLIEETEHGYKATKTGILLLRQLDICPICNSLREPYSATTHYTTAMGYSRTYDSGIRYICKHEIQEIYKNQSGCNFQTSYQPFKHTNKRTAEINKIAGITTKEK
jgi:hypothetical protein